MFELIQELGKFENDIKNRKNLSPEFMRGYLECVSDTRAAIEGMYRRNFKNLRGG